jgi:hypothetical protein
MTYEKGKNDKGSYRVPFKVLPQHLPQGTQKTHEKTQSEHLDSGSRIEFTAYRKGSTMITTKPVTFNA